MTDFEDQKIVTQTTALHSANTSLYSTQQVPTINGVSVPTLFERVVRRNRKKATPHTLRRPSYLQYIDY